MQDQDLENRIARAVELFKAGFNCSQSVSAAFADLFGYTEEQMLLLSASFGGGIGRMRLTCGAACGMFLLAGLATGTSDPKNAEGKAANYKLVQELAAKFKEQNGSLTCAELLARAVEVKTNPNPDARTAQYYAKRPCAKIVEGAATIFADYLKKS